MSDKIKGEIMSVTETVNYVNVDASSYIVGHEDVKGDIEPPTIRYKYRLTLRNPDNGNTASIDLTNKQYNDLVLKLYNWGKK